MNFEDVIQKINTFVTIDKDDRQAYTEDFDNVRDALEREMKHADEVFAQMSRGHNLGGSYADNLKISKPDEFDLVMHLQLPDQNLIKLKSVSKLPGYVTINIGDLIKKIEKERQNKKLYDRLKKLVDNNNYLMQSKVSSWIQGILAKVMITFPHYMLKYGGKEYELKYSMHGPAHTIDVRCERRYFSIDFVPAIVFDTSVWHVARACPLLGREKGWIAIPKPLKMDNCYDINNLFWITSYVDQERFLISSQYYLKPSIRLLKKLRDRFNITNLKSYYIKTSFLWLLEKKRKENNEGFWRTGVSTVFLQGFKFLLEFTEKGHLPFYWNDNFNMFATLTNQQKISMHNQLYSIYQGILKYKDDHPEKIYGAFLTDRELLALTKEDTIINEERQKARENSGGLCTIV